MSGTWTLSKLRTFRSGCAGMHERLLLGPKPKGKNRSLSRRPERRRAGAYDARSGRSARTVAPNSVNVDVGVVVPMLAPRTMHGNDHPLGRIDVDVLAASADRRKGATVDAGRHVRQCPPLVAVSRGGAGHEPTECGRRAGGRTRRPLTAWPSSSTSWPKRPTSRRHALMPAPPSSWPSSASSAQYPSASMPAGPQILSAQ
jgi:hypothetical protein